MKYNTKEILHWYTQNARILPWRHSGISAYEVWVSEVMLQQTQVSRGILYYEKFLKKYSTVEKLAETTWEEFLPYYEGLGYYARGRNMLRTAKIIVEEFEGEFPKDKSLLMKLAGVGEYTASAILSFAYELPFVAFDTNFKKIFETKENAEKAFRASGVTSAIFNSAVMDYANAHKSTKSKVHKVSKVTARGQTIVVLHENHKIYFSENSKTYQPFVMPYGTTSRSDIKKYFLEKYALRLSVRPSQKGKVNAQILSGKHEFATYSKSVINVV